MNKLSERLQDVIACINCAESEFATCAEDGEAFAAERAAVTKAADAMDEAIEALERFIALERSIKIDVGLLHKNRLRQSTSSDLQIATDADFRTELEKAFDKARAALTKLRGSEGEE